MIKNVYIMIYYAMLIYAIYYLCKCGKKNYITLFTCNNVQKCVFIYIGQTKIKCQ